MLDRASNSDRKSQRNSSKRNDFFDAGISVDPLRMINRYWHFIAMSVLIGWVLASVYYLIAPPTYLSTAELLLEPKDPGAAANGVTASSGKDTMSDDGLASHLSMIQSNRIITEAIEQSGLSEMPSLLDDLSGADRNFSDALKKKLSVTRGGSGAAKKSNTLKLELKHDNAEDCKYLLSAIVNRYQAFVKEKFVDDKNNLTTTISRAQDLNQQELASANAQYRKFRQDSPILWSGGQGTNMPLVLHGKIQDELSTVQLLKTELQSRLEVVQEQLKEIANREALNPESKRANDLERLSLIDAKSAERVNIFLQVLAGDASTAEFQSTQPLRVAAAQTEAAGLLELRQREKKLLQEFGEQHPDIKVVREQITEMQKFISEKNAQTSFTPEEALVDPTTLVAAYVQLLKNDVMDLDKKQQQLMNQSVQAEKEARALIDFELEGEILKEKVDDLRLLYEATIDKLRDINLVSGYGGLISESLESPQIGKLVAPLASICLAVGTLLGGFAGLGIALLKEFQNRELRTAKEIEAIASLPIISQVPNLSLLQDREYLEKCQTKAPEIQPIVCAHHDATARESEVFRGLRTALMFKLGENATKTIAITSANSGDGKSTLSSNIAVSIAQAGRRVVIVECDMRKPAVAKLFSRSSPVGLAEYLSGRASLEEVTQDTGVNGLSIIAAGTSPDNPAELLASPAFESFISILEASYDLILLDCPPVLAVADPCIISEHVGAVLVVVRLNPQSRTELLRTMDILNSVEAKSVGIIVNDSRLEDEVSGGSRYGYMVGYGYGTYKDKANSYYLKDGKATSHKELRT
jgi:polysaccharide biosynthesis transport protein